MGEASFQQTSFLGGEWGGFSQGRLDLPNYRIALKLSLNGLPMEEGAWTRRSGSRRLGATSFLASGVVRTFWLPGHIPCILELTYSNREGKSFLRFWTQQFPGNESDDFQPLCDSYVQIANISQGNPCVVTLAGTPPLPMNGGGGWATGDEVVIYIDPSVPLANGPLFVNKQFRIAQVGTNQWALYDVLANASFDGSQPGAQVQQLGNSYVGHIARFQGPWQSLAEVKNLRVVQSGGTQAQPAYILSATTAPWALTLISPAPSNAIGPNAPWFTFAQATFVDGPYLDPLPGNSQTGNSTGAISNIAAATPTFTIMDGAYTFQASDIGRQIRLWWQPQLYNPGTPIVYDAAMNAQLAGETNIFVSRCTYNGSYWVANAGEQFIQGQPPGAVVAGLGGGKVQAWAQLPPTAAFWLHGTIATVNGNSCTITFDAAQQNLLINDLAVSQYIAAVGGQIDTWQLGLYTATQSGILAGGYPTNGFFNEGRLHLIGALPNRGDASAPLGVTITPPYGPGPNGFEIIQGSAGGLIVQPTSPPPSASPYYLGLTNSLNAYSTPCFSPTVLQGGDVFDDNGFSYIADAADENQFLWGVPFQNTVILGTKGGEFLLEGSTPTTVTLRKHTHYRSGTTQPLAIGQAVIFVQSLGRLLEEYVMDPFLKKFQGRHLNEYAKHLSGTGINEIAYQEETIPVVWGAMNDGSLAGCTYRRLVSGFVQAEPQMFGWHRQKLANGRKVASVTTGANTNGTLDQLVMLTTDGQDA